MKEHSHSHLYVSIFYAFPFYACIIIISDIVMIFLLVLLFRCVYIFNMCFIITVLIKSFYQLFPLGSGDLFNQGK